MTPAVLPIRALAALVFLAVLAPGRTADAKPDAFTSFVASVGRDAPDASWLADCQALVTPAAEIRRPCKLTLADLGGKGVKLVVTRNTVSDFRRSMLEYREAIVEARSNGRVVATYHVLEVGASGGNPDKPSGPMAVHWSRLVPDKQVAAAAVNDKWPAPPTVRDVTPASSRPGTASEDDRSLYDDLGRVATLDRDKVRDSIEAGGVAFGSAPGQRYAGKVGARAVAGWKLQLVPSGGIHRAGGNRIGVAITKITAIVDDARPYEIPYLGFFVFTQRTTGGGSVGSELALSKFAVVR